MDVKEQYQIIYDQILTATGDDYIRLYNKMEELQAEYVRKYGPLPQWMANIPSEVNTPSDGDGTRGEPDNPLGFDPPYEFDPPGDGDDPRGDPIVEPSPGTGETPQDIGRTDDELREDLAEEWRNLVVEADPLTEASKITPPGDITAGIFEDTTRAELKQQFDDIIEKLKTIKILWEKEYELGPFEPYMLYYPVWYKYRECLALFDIQKKELAARINVEIEKLIETVDELGELQIPRDNPQRLTERYNNKVKAINEIKKEYKDLVDCAYKEATGEFKKALKNEPPFDIKPKEQYPMPKLTFSLVPGKTGGFDPADTKIPDKDSDGVQFTIPPEIMLAGGGIIAGIFVLASQGKTGNLAQRIQEAAESIAWSSVYVAGGITVVIAGKSFFICLDEVNGDFYRAVGCTISKTITTIIEGTIEIIDVLVKTLLNALGEFVEEIIPMVAEMLVQMMESLGKAIANLGSSLTGGILPGADGGGGGPLGGALGSISSGLDSVFDF